MDAHALGGALIAFMEDEIEEDILEGQSTPQRLAIQEEIIESLTRLAGLLI